MICVTHSENKNPAALSEVNIYHDSNIFTFIPILSEGQMGEAWEPSKKWRSFFTQLMCVPVPPRLCFFTYSSTILLYFSLSLYKGISWLL
jgi:hypothetical protein